MKFRLLLSTLAVAFAAAQPGMDATDPTLPTGTGPTDPTDATDATGAFDGPTDATGPTVGTDATDPTDSLVVESDATPTGSMVDLLLGDEKFSTFIEAITAAGLIGALAAPGPLTIFAPTNDAFEDVDLDLLFEPVWIHHLRGILDFHVIEGAVKSTDLDVDTTFVTMEGGNITVTDLEPVTMNFDSNVTTADIAVTNGVVHVINNVLLPSFTSYTATELAATMPLQFSTFVDLLQLANLTGVLDGVGPFTVFAPSNEAFESLDDDDLMYLTSEEGFDDLVDLLKYHVVSGIAMSSDIMVGDAAIALNGENMTVTMVDPEVVINGVSTVISPDNFVVNGVVHFIDTVLLPGEEQEDIEMPENTLGDYDVADFVGTSSNHTTLYDLLNYTDLLGYLEAENDDTITLMAPIDSAFDDIGGIDKYLNEEWFAHLYDILSYHVVNGALNSSALYQGLDFEAVQGDYINVTGVDPDITLNDESHVIEGDVLLINGVIHSIDHVLLPTSALYNILEMGEDDPDYSLFIQFVRKAGLVDLFTGDGPYTVFAPSNAAFQRLSSETIAHLESEEGAEDLAAVLKFHVVPGNILSYDLEDGDMFATMEGEMIKVSLDDDGNVLVNDVMIEDSDVLANNGVIHSLETVLVPEKIMTVAMSPPAATEEAEESEENSDAGDEAVDVPEVVVAKSVPTAGVMSSFSVVQSSMLLGIISYLLLA